MNSGVNERRGRGFFFPLLSMVDILSGAQPLISDVRRSGSSPHVQRDGARYCAVPTRWPRCDERLPGASRVPEFRALLARLEESHGGGELLKAATVEIEQAHLDGAAAGQCGTWLLEGLSGVDRALTEPLVRAAAEGRLQEAALALTLPLVAQARDGELVGALLALPPGKVVQTVRDAGYPQHALLAMLNYVKIKALAVAQKAQGQGLGAALLKRCTQLYWKLDFMLLYGEFETECALRPFYERQGFTVLEPGKCTDVGYALTGRPIGLGAGPGSSSSSSGEKLIPRLETGAAEAGVLARVD
ncbi:GNAT family N-acetyltransferase [Streptomyces noursei]|uniref:GNAT family N-acetyltransferase n=1 Tax=Streptomyces noursei TaxID=1971 RepID=UPI0021A95718|nr:GNAT family N-acetyltransferase [Streptomyces noursei]UWS69839.1 GNAT family N-acetyltransferase [Streptomyces noursei]UWS76940.1 GNAT family N-acetyltransferase [Streptomyces noursei]